MSTNATYFTTVTKGGEWIHGKGSLMLAYMEKDWTPDQLKILKQEFVKVMSMPAKINQAVKNTSLSPIADSTYTLDQEAMTRAMNTIPGMGMTSSGEQHQEGDGTVVEITTNFFAQVLGTSLIDLIPIAPFLVDQMQVVQSETKQLQSEVSGTLIGIVSLVPGIDVATTVFKYVYISKKDTAWMKNLACSSKSKQHYDYVYDEVTYSYTPDS